MRYFQWLIVLLLPSAVTAQHSIVIDTLKIHSRLLNMDRNYAVYLPADYYSSGKTYPVLYLLHGGGVDHRGWTQQGEIQSIMDKGIADGSVTQMIIVMPDAFTSRRGYFQNKDNWPFEDFFFTEFMPYIESTYRIRKEQNFRAICGFSIGGKAAFTYTFHHPGTFGAACPLSAATFVEEAKPATIDLKNNNDILSLVNSVPDSMKNKTRWYIDCGDEDVLCDGNLIARTAMLKSNIKTEMRVRNGGHNWEY